MVLVHKLNKVELLAVLAEEFSKEISIVKIFLEVGDPAGELHLVV